MTIVLILAAWLVVGTVVALLIGRVIRRREDEDRRLHDAGELADRAAWWLDNFHRTRTSVGTAPQRLRP